MGKLDGRRIVVPESRSLDLFCAMLEREGAQAVRCPLVSIHDAQDPAPVVAWLRRLAEGAMDDLFLSTGEGVRRLIGFASRAGVQPEVLAGFARARIVCRGPKPQRALREVGLSAQIIAEPATTDGVLAAAADLDLRGRRVGVQLYPEQPDTLVTWLKEAGAEVDSILCYRYASDAEEELVAATIEQIVAGAVDMIAFTSAPQVRRLAEVADRRGRRNALTSAFERTLVAAVGPVTAVAVEKAGWRVRAMPEENFHLKPFVGEIAQAFVAVG
ncbi:uroporphyrinogen-III synthase [Chelatococcus reniformis]|uniref:Uroporphyrinogen III methyltransferase n=1 Tax=Chelatococcus reniformis TaxID=1494448 RepID=A0A916UNX9_9HYPH|nr:uroporphyrinogen-III synthase [Chelatococcus reniformis]GGC80693.1 uroporphyrinogen III methyltransferase [Chelatococcus reniformis]